ncbi:hypothetical protein NLI96_g13019 [Meripilus lineatus]|uniref:Uncharacterized protein n=1 Tax=Meripilus lineatus TaxID=2056292 RepID=A0AAD5UNU9_9APHY|nr:hypothetical protein NLI96_g13019 [Physisporinus lineatus]
MRARTTLPDPMTFKDALVATASQCGNTVITSPNMNYIPIPALGQLCVQIRADGRFGVEDPIQWPQMLSHKYCHYSCILRRPIEPHIPRQVMWRKVTPQDFVVSHGSLVSGIGILAESFRLDLALFVDMMSRDVSKYQERTSRTMSHLNFCEMSMRTSLACLLFPSTYRDLTIQVVNVQRYYLECEAWLYWYGTVDERILTASQGRRVDEVRMGAFTADPASTAKLFSAGIPVWLFRIPSAITTDTAIAEIVAFSEPNEITTDIGIFGSVVYRGLPGEGHHAAISLGGHTYLDIPKVFLPPPSGDDQISTSSPNTTSHSSDAARPSGAGPIRSQTRIVRPSPYDATRTSRAEHSTSTAKQTSRLPSNPTSNATSAKGKGKGKAKGKGKGNGKTTKPPVPQRNKFVETHSEFLPPQISVWAECLAAVDQKAETIGKINYFVPEPALIMAQTIRPENFEPIHQQWWRDYLNHVRLDDAGKPGTATGERKGEVFALFNTIFPDSMVTSPGQPSFFGKELRELDARLCQEVLWEVYEMGFRMELLAMDRKLCPSDSGPQPSADSLYSEQRRVERVAEVFSQKTHIRISALPTSHSGLAAEDIKDRAPALEALRQILKQWPGAPPSIKTREISAGMSADVLHMAEKSLIQFYADTFYRYSSRAPLVPHRFPL